MNGTTNTVTTKMQPLAGLGLRLGWLVDARQKRPITAIIRHNQETE